MGGAGLGHRPSGRSGGHRGRRGNRMVAARQPWLGHAVEGGGALRTGRVRRRLRHTPRDGAGDAMARVAGVGGAPSCRARTRLVAAAGATHLCPPCLIRRARPGAAVGAPAYRLRTGQRASASRPAHLRRPRHRSRSRRRRLARLVSRQGRPAPSLPGDRAVGRSVYTCERARVSLLFERDPRASHRSAFRHTGGGVSDGGRTVPPPA